MTIKIQQAIWWHAAVFSPTADAPSFDPTSTVGGMSSLRLDGAPPAGIDPRYFTSASPGVLAGKFCDTLRSFSLSAVDTNLDSEVDTVVDHPTFGVRMGDPTLLDARVIFNPTAVEAQAIFGAPKLVVKLEDFVTARVPLSYMLMAVYNSGLSLQCSDRVIPDEWFTHDTIPGALVDPVSAAELQAAMQPAPQRTSDGLDAGFFVQFAAQQDVTQLGCCGVVVGGYSSSTSTGVPTGQCAEGPTLRAWQDTPARTRIWAVRAGVRGLVSPALSPTWSCFGPTPQELVYAEFDDDTKLDTAIDSSVITWHHAGFVVLEDNHGLMFPTDFSGTSSDDSFNLGSSYDYQRRLPVDIVDIAWDDRGWLWGVCTGPSRTEGGIPSSPEATVDGIYRILPGGWSYQRADTISFGGHFFGETEVTARLVESRMGGFSKVACGDGYTLYLTTDGHLEFVAQSSTPAHVPPPEVVSPAQVVLDIAASSTHAACILSDGTLRVWSMGGSGTYITDADGVPNMLKVSCGDGITCAIGTDGNIHAFGVSFVPPEASDPISPFISLDCGDSHIAGLTEDGRMIVAGAYSDTSDATATVNNVTAFACGDDCTLYTEVSASSFINYLGPAGSPLSNPPIATNMDVVALAAAERHAVALAKSSGCTTCSAYALPWGDGSATETGISLTRGQSPISLDGQDQKFVAVSCGKRHTCLITDGSLLEPRYGPARLVYRSKVSLATDVVIPDEPAAVMTRSSDSGSPLASVSVYDDSTVILGDSTVYNDNPFDFSERVGLKIYDVESRTIRILGANWRPHRLRVGVDDTQKLTPCTDAQFESSSHLVLPPTSDLTVSDHDTTNPSLLTVMQLPETAGSVNSSFDWKLDAASFALRIYSNSGSSAAVPQASPLVVSATGAGVVLGVSTFNGGGYSAASAIMPQSFIAGADLVTTLGSQVFMRNDEVDQAAGSGGQGWPQIPSICPYRDGFDNSISGSGYSMCSVGREYLLPPDGGLSGVDELSYLSSAWRLRAAIPKTSIDTSGGSLSITAPFTSDDTGISDPVVDIDYSLNEASITATGLQDYDFALGPRSLCLVAPNRYPITSTQCLPDLQWKFAETTIPCFGGNAGANSAFVAAPISNINGLSSIEDARVINVNLSLSPTSARRKVAGCDLVDSRNIGSANLCASVGLGVYRPGSGEERFSIIETRWLESDGGAVVGMSSSTQARPVQYVLNGTITNFTNVIDFNVPNTLPEVKIFGCRAGAVILRKRLLLANGNPTWNIAEILHLPKDPDGSISTDVTEPRVLANGTWDRVTDSRAVWNVLMADGGDFGEPFLGMVVVGDVGPIQLKWMMGSGGRFSDGNTSFASRWSAAESQLQGITWINSEPQARNMSAQFMRRHDSSSDLVIIVYNRIMYKTFGSQSFTVVDISSSGIVFNGPTALVHTPSGDRLIAAQSDENKVDFYEFSTDDGGHPTGISHIGFFIHGLNERPVMKADGHRLLLQFAPATNGDPRHLVLDIGEVSSSAASTTLSGELKAAALLHAQAAPLRTSVNPDENQDAAPFMYVDGTPGGQGAQLIYPQTASGAGNALQSSLSDERLGSFASMPSAFHPLAASGGRFFVENTNKAFRVYEVSSDGFNCVQRITDEPGLQQLSPGSLNDLMSFEAYRPNQTMPLLSPWGNPYSSICGVYGRVFTNEQRVLMIGDRLYSMGADGSLGPTPSSRALPLSSPISWVTEMNARAADLEVNPSAVQAFRPERFGGVSPYRRVKTRHLLNSSIRVPFGGSTPVSVPRSATGSDIHAWAYWGRWLFRLGTSGTTVSVGQAVDIPDNGASHPFSTWFHSPTGSGSPVEGYSDFLDGYVTAASSAAGLVISNSRCHWMANASTTPDPARMEVRVFAYNSETWSRTQTIVLSDPATMGADDIGFKYHPDSYLPQRLSMALSADGRLLAVAGHRWQVTGSGIPQNTQVAIFRRGATGFSKAAVINASDASTVDILGDFASHMEFKDNGGGVYTLNISCSFDPLGPGNSDVSSMAARNRMVSYTIDVNGAFARVAECNDLLPAGELGFLNSAAANLNHWVASPSPAYNGIQSAAWTGSNMTITTLNRLISLQSDRSNWRVVDHISRPYRYTDAKVLAIDFSAYRSGFSCPASSAACNAVTDIPQMPSPAGGYSSMDGRVRASFFVPPTLSSVNDAGFYQVDNSGGTDKGWWDGISADSQLSTLPHMSHVAALNRVPRSTAAGEAIWNPSTQGAIRIVPLSGASAGVPSTIGGGFGCTVRRPLFAANAGVNRLDWPYSGALQVQPKHLIRFQDESTSLRSTSANNLDLIDAGTVSMTRNASNIIVMKDAIDRASVAGSAIPSVAPALWGELSKNAEDLGQLVSLRITSGVVQVRGFTTESIFPESASPMVSSASQRFGIKRPMSITVGGNSVCGAGSFDIARPARSPFAPLEGRAGGRGGSPWLILFERHGVDNSYFTYSGADFGTRGISLIDHTVLRKADPFMVSPQAPFDPIGHVDRMGWCSNSCYPLGGNSTTISEAIVDMVRGFLDPDNGSVFNGDRIGLGTTDGYAMATPPSDYVWAYPDPTGGFGTTVRCLCKSTVFDSYEWVRKTFRIATSNIGSGEVALRVLHGAGAALDPAAPFYSRFNEDGNPLKNLIFVLTVDSNTGNSAVLNTPMGSQDGATREGWAESVFTALRNADIIEANGSIHFIDMVKRDLSDPYRRACETLAEVSGGSYISLGRQWPTAPT